MLTSLLIMSKPLNTAQTFNIFIIPCKIKYTEFCEDATKGVC